MRLLLATAMVIGCGVALVWLTANRSPAVKLAPGWTIEQVAAAPDILFPTAIVTAPDGTTYLGQDPMDMPGPAHLPSDSVVAIKDGKVKVFADHLWAVMGLEWVDGALIVVHAPFLSAFRDTDHDGKADQRIDLVTGLGPKNPAFNGVNDHIASGIRLGMDGFLYISVGDKGIPKAIGADGSTIHLQGGGVIRVRPDGGDLEIVSTGERNPLSVALTAEDDIFTYGNDDDSKKWPNSLTHHIVGGHYGYPREFLSAPDRALPIVDGRIGGAGAQGICYNEDGLAERFQGNLFFCDWGLGAVVRYDLARSGGTFSVKSKEYIVRKGTMADFRPFSLAVGDGGNALYLADWGFNGFLVNGPKTGRLFRLKYEGRDRAFSSFKPTANTLTLEIEALDHPAFSVRLAAQRSLAKRGSASTPFLIARMGRPGLGRLHALWGLDAIGGDASRLAIRTVLSTGDSGIRSQAARSAGIRRDREALAELGRRLEDSDVLVRRESAIALGRIGSEAALPALFRALGEPDRFAAWSVRGAIRSIGLHDSERLVEALEAPVRRDNAILLCDEWWSVPVAQALIASLRRSDQAAWRVRLLTTMSGLYRRYPVDEEGWHGPNPLAEAPPRKTRDWDSAGMALVLEGLALGARDAAPDARGKAIAGLIDVGQPALPVLRTRLAEETDPGVLSAIAKGVGELADTVSLPLLPRIAADNRTPRTTREAAVGSLATFDDPNARRARLALARHEASPPWLVARAIGHSGAGNPFQDADLAPFLGHHDPSVQEAAIRAIASSESVSPEIRRAIQERLGDPSNAVRMAAIEAVGSLKIRESIPRLLEFAAGANATAAVTRSLAAMPDTRALPVFLDALGAADPDERRDGVSALTQLRDLVASDLRVRLASGEFRGAQAIAIENILAKFQPVIDWKLMGPFPRNTPPMFRDPASIDFGHSETGADGRQLTWNARSGDAATGRVMIDELAPSHEPGYSAKGSADLVSFAYAEVVADQPGEVLAQAGSSGSLSVAVNGKNAFHSDNPSGRAYQPNSDQSRIALNQGVNRIVVRTRQGIGNWSFGLRLSTRLTSRGEQRIAASELRGHALTHRGDASKGEVLFFDSKGVGCVKCHAASGRGASRIGPDLTGLALKYDTEEIIRSVLEPSNRLAIGYIPVVIATIEGEVISGLLRAETQEYLDLVGSDLTTCRVKKSSMETRRVGETSFMPAGLVDSLSKEQFTDLIAFLKSQTR